MSNMAGRLYKFTLNPMGNSCMQKRLLLKYLCYTPNQEC
jgi:hypothetical protein